MLPNLDIDALFGNDAGEEESPEYLTDVYLLNPVYEKAISEDRVLCVRSRKGVGKSALLSRASLEIESRKIPALSLLPTDFLIPSDAKDYNLLVRHYRSQLARLCVAKVAEKMKIAATGDTEKAIQIAEEDGFRSADLFSRVARTFQQVVNAEVQKNPQSEASRLLNRLLHNQPLYVFLDDIDRGWKPDHFESEKLKAFITAVREIAKVNQTIKFRLAIREDVWQYLETKDEQIDKFRQYSVLLSWDEKSLVKILTRRIRHYLLKKSSDHKPIPSDDIQCLNLLFEQTYRWDDETKQMHEVLVQLCRRRPRDLIQLGKGAAKRAILSRSKIITKEHVRTEYYDSFSKVKIQDLYKEFRNECEELEKLITVFGGNSRHYVMNYSEVDSLVNSVNGNTAITIFGKRASNLECVSFLYRAGFISARQLLKENSYKHLIFEDYPQLVDTNVGLSGFDWEVHPAFRPHLRSIQASPFQVQFKKKRQQSRGRRF